MRLALGAQSKLQVKAVVETLAPTAGCVKARAKAACRVGFRPASRCTQVQQGKEFCWSCLDFLPLPLWLCGAGPPGLWCGRDAHLYPSERPCPAARVQLSKLGDTLGLLRP